MDTTLSYCGITPAAIVKIEATLKRLLKDTGLGCAMAIDHSGYVIARKGEVEHVRPDDLAAIAAGSFASYEMMLRTREMTIVFHTKGIDNLHFARVNSNVVLVALYNDSTDIGIIRPKIKTAVQQIKEALGKEDTVSARLGSLSFITSKLDEMFKEK